MREWGTANAKGADRQLADEELTALWQVSHSRPPPMRCHPTNDRSRLKELTALWQSNGVREWLHNNQPPFPHLLLLRQR